MVNTVRQDGGYYAIKGFAYQVDKAILEVLNTDDENENINIEQIQDIDLNDSVIQVKYKEIAKLVPSQINTPIAKLIEEFKIDNTKKYILYAYFNDLNRYAEKIDENKQISKDTLDELLGNLTDNFTNEVKNNFVNNFYLDFSPEFQNQFNSVIVKLQELGFGNSDEETMFYYANISDYLYKIVTDNPPMEAQNRTCTKKEIFDYLKKGKNLIFNSSFREYQGNQKYFSFIKKQHFSNRNIDYIERFIIVELSGHESIVDIKEVVFKINNKFYNKSGTWKFQRIKSPAPYIYFKNISDNNLVQLKTELSKDGIIFKDGFDFAGTDFSLDSIMQDSTIYNNLCLKFVNSENILHKLVNENFQKPKEIYQFYRNKSITIESDIKNIGIQIKSISDINFIL